MKNKMFQQEVVLMREGPIVIFALSTRLGPLPVDSPIVVELVQRILGRVSHDEIIVHGAPSTIQSTDDPAKIQKDSCQNSGDEKSGRRDLRVTDADRFAGEMEPSV